MTTAYTSLLGFALPATGDLSGTWGQTVNDSITQLVETAIAGTKTADVESSNWTLTDIDGEDDTARAAVLIPTGNNGATTRSILAPNQSKIYVVINQASGSVVIKGVTGPTTGVTVTAGSQAIVAWNGSDFVNLTPISSGGGTVTSVAATVPSFLSVTGSPITGAGTLAIGLSGTALPVANGGTGTTTPALVAGTNVTISGTWPNQTINSTGGGGGTVTSVGMTVPSFLSVSPSSITSSGTFAVTFPTSSNLYIGKSSGAANTTGYSNTAIGSTVLSNNLTGFENTAVGDQALTTMTAGQQNTAIGSYCMSYGSSGNGNTAVGRTALNSLGLTGSYNAAVGLSAGGLNTSGSNNTFIGTSSGLSNTTGSGNIAIGPVTASGSTLPVFSLSTVDNRIVMGSTAATNAYIQVAWTVVSDARDKTNFAPVPHGLDFVNKLLPTAYQFKVSREDDTPTGILRYGFKAQDILELEGDTPVIIDNEDVEKLRFNSDSLIPVLVNAIKELTVRLETLENKVA